MKENFSLIREQKTFNDALVLYLVFFASIFFTKTQPNWPLRVVYSFLLYSTIVYIIGFYIKSLSLSSKIGFPNFYKFYIVLLLIFIAHNLWLDILNPNFNLITLINNPYALFAVIPIFAFGIGFNTLNLNRFYRFGVFVSYFFIFFFLLIFFKNFSWYQNFQGYHVYVASSIIIPLYILSDNNPKARKYCYLLIFMACIFSILIDYRSVILRFLIFFPILLLFNLFNKSVFLKFLVLICSCVVVYILIVNLDDLLELVKGHIADQSLATNTRTFLYEELFSDLNSKEIILGRGFLGTYYSDFFWYILSQGIIEDDQQNRFISEVGFLILILKGGFIYYILYIFPLLFSSLRGIFIKSQDPLSFNIAIYIFAELLLMFFENIPHFTLNFFLLFFLAGFIYRRTSEPIKLEPLVKDKALAFKS
jgi:hypothetical protein